jgi:hypothetical protein
MNVICTVALLYGVYNHADLKGIVIAQNDVKYAVNFSEEAKANNYKGDYSHILVNKSECVELK